MAKYEGTIVARTHLYGAIAAREQFYHDFKGAGAVENVHSYL
jgi:hypothetical protein